MATFRSEFGVPSQAADRPEADATASPETCSVERPFPSAVLEMNPAILLL
jgi:hypothetical protein